MYWSDVFTAQHPDTNRNSIYELRHYSKCKNVIFATFFLYFFFIILTNLSISNLFGGVIIFYAVKIKGLQRLELCILGFSVFIFIYVHLKNKTIFSPILYILKLPKI